MEQSRRILTHFYRRNPEPDGWIHTTFVTRIKGDSTYYFGLSDHIVPSGKVAEDIETGSLVTLAKIVHIYPGQTVWIYADQSAFLADAKDPRKGEKIFEEQLSSNYDYIEKTIEAKIKDPILNTNDPLISPLLGEQYWQTLVDIIISKIQAGEIDETGFKQIGYIFAELSPIYNTEFKKLLNRRDVAYSEGELRFMDKNFIFQRWEFYVEEEDPESFYKKYSDFDILAQ